MDKWLKYIKRLRKRDQIRLLETIGLIMKNQSENLDIKKLNGYQKLYRVRIGRYRILFETEEGMNQVNDVPRSKLTGYQNKLSETLE